MSAVAPLKNVDKTNDGEYRLRRIEAEIRSIGADSRFAEYGCALIIFY